MNPNRYRKLIAAVIGITIFITLGYFEIDLMGLDPVVVDLIVGAAMAWGVYQAPNDYT